MIEPSHAYSPRVMSLLLHIFDFGQSGELNLCLCTIDDMQARQWLICSILDVL